MAGVSHAGVGVAKWAGDLECSVCRRKRLIANEFSKKMLEKRRAEPQAALKCKQCVEATAAAERGAASSGTGEPQVCAACERTLAASEFTKPQLKKGPGKQRCTTCVEASVASQEATRQASKEAALAEAKRAVDAAGSAAERLAASSKLAALEGELVTGVAPRRSSSSFKGRGGSALSRRRR